MVITRKALRRWATAQKEGNNVGVSHSIGSCPIATYIHAKGGNNPFVGDKRIRWDDPETGARIERHTAPDLSEVIHCVDGWYLGPVTREEFLAVLDSVDQAFGG